jgi:hypothetical protein
MRVKLLALPLFLAGAILIGCDDKKSPSADVNAADAKASVDKAAADAKAVAAKEAEDAKATADKAAANAQAAGTKDAADAKAADAKAAADKSAEADKATADAKAAADKVAADKTAAEALQKQSSTLLADLKTSITDQKWSGAETIIKQLDEVRDKLTPDQKTSFDSLKKEYEDKKK